MEKPEKTQKIHENCGNIGNNLGSHNRDLLVFLKDYRIIIYALKSLFRPLCRLVGHPTV